MIIISIIWHDFKGILFQFHIRISLSRRKQMRIRVIAVNLQ